MLYGSHTELPRGVSHPQAAHSLGMFLVDRAINTDGGAKTLLALVLLDSPQHGGQGGCAQAGRARGHNLADSVCGHTVLLQRTQTQTHQDLVGLLYPILLPGKQIGCEQWRTHCDWWAGLWAGLGSAPSSSKLPHRGRADSFSRREYSITQQF